MLVIVRVFYFAAPITHHPCSVARHGHHSCYSPSMPVDIQSATAQQVLWELMDSGSETKQGCLTPDKWSKPAEVLTFLRSIWVTQKSLHLTCMYLLSSRLCQAVIWLLPCYVSWWKLNTLPQNSSLSSNLPNSCSCFLAKASFVWCRIHAWLLIYVQ
jgi:hypothetical protein